MKTFLSIIAFTFVLAIFAVAFAGNKMHSSAEYQKIDDAGRAHLQECLNNKSMSIKSCVKQTKKMIKKQIKAVKEHAKNAE